LRLEFRPMLSIAASERIGQNPGAESLDIEQPILGVPRGLELDNFGHGSTARSWSEAARGPSETARGGPSGRPPARAADRGLGVAPDGMR